MAPGSGTSDLAARRHVDYNRDTVQSFTLEYRIDV